MPDYRFEGYGFKYAIKDKSEGLLTWKYPELSGKFTLKAKVELVSTPKLTRAKDRWIGFVQVILDDNMFLQYGDDEILVVRSFSNLGGRCRDLDATQMYLDRGITLFDLSEHSTYPISLKKDSRGQSAYFNQPRNPRKLLKVKENTILFDDTPTFTFGRLRRAYDYALKTPILGQFSVGFTSPSGAALTDVTGVTRFSLWLVLMKNPKMVATGRYAPMYSDRPEVPAGPQSMGEFHPIYHWQWHLNWAGLVNQRTVAPKGRVVVTDEGPGKGTANPIFGNGEVATEKMGYARVR